MFVPRPLGSLGRFNPVQLFLLSLDRIANGLRRSYSASCLFVAVGLLGGCGRMEPVVLGVGGVREGVVVAGSLLGRYLATVGLACALSVGDPFVDLVVSPVLSV